MKTLNKAETIKLFKKVFDNTKDLYAQWYEFQVELIKDGYRLDGKKTHTAYNLKALMEE